jgi:predicted MFS family arabinose efflux permease
MTGPNIMPELKPDLLQSTMPWYRGLTRGQWWVLLVASMGWMFDTMDQQFFNLGRGPAMDELHGYGGMRISKDLLAKYDQDIFAAAELDAMVAAGLLDPAQRSKLSDGSPRRAVAKAVGEKALSDKYAERGSNILSGHTQENFDRAGFDQLVNDKIISKQFADDKLSKTPSGVIARVELARALGENEAKVEARKAGDHSTTIFIIGWAIGGLAFGLIGDRLGRAKTMAITILVYALFTGLSGLARNMFEFNVYRFLTALGVGGEFAAGAALVAETMPNRSRAAALGSLQALSAIGNMTGAALAFVVMPLYGWRWLFAIGALPGIVAVLCFLGLREPEKWKEARAKAAVEKAAGKKTVGSYTALFSDPRWRRNAIVGMLLGVVGVAGLWGVAFFTPELIRIVTQKRAPEEREKIVAITFFLQQVGAFFGIAGYTWLSLRVGRKPAFATFFILCFVVMGYTFLFLNSEFQAFLLLPLVGFVTLGPFGGYAIYFPELFPTRLRATGTGFCYNVGRFLAALSPSIKAMLSGLFYGGTIGLPFLVGAINNAELATRYASVMMIFVYLLGLIVLIWAPETKGQPLPED